MHHAAGSRGPRVSSEQGDDRAPSDTAPIGSMTRLFALLSSSLLAHSALSAAAAAPLRNVLLITVDDLRPQLNEAYGMTETVTPHLDKFAKESLTFTRAYCQMAVCSPSRNSFMSGRRPDTTKVWNFINHFREPSVGPNWTTFPEYFKKHGYLTFASGKLYHPAHPPNNDFPASWTVDPTENPYYWGNSAPIGDAGGCGSGLTVPLKSAWGSNAVCYDNDDAAAMNVADNKSAPQGSQPVEYDFRLATRTIEYITYANKAQKNFFVGVGFRRPHLAWRQPRQFYALYANANLSVAKHMTIGTNITTLAYERNGEMGQLYTDARTGKKYTESYDGKPPSGPAGSSSAFHSPPQQQQQQQCLASYHIIHGYGLMNKSTTIGLRNANTSAHCCALCVSTAGCAAWTFHGGPQDCWLTAHPVTPHASGGAVSGTKHALPPLPPPRPAHRGKVEQAPLPVLLQQELRRGYYASVSFTDHNVGRVLDALDALPGLKENTAVLFVSRHAATDTALRPRRACVLARWLLSQPCLLSACPPACLLVPFGCGGVVCC